MQLSGSNFPVKSLRLEFEKIKIIFNLSYNFNEDEIALQTFFAICNLNSNKVF